VTHAIDAPNVSSKMSKGLHRMSCENFWGWTLAVLQFLS